MWCRELKKLLKIFCPLLWFFFFYWGCWLDDYEKMSKNKLKVFMVREPTLKAMQDLGTDRIIGILREFSLAEIFKSRFCFFHFMQKWIKLRQSHFHKQIFMVSASIYHKLQLKKGLTNNLQVITAWRYSKLPLHVNQLIDHECLPNNWTRKSYEVCLPFFLNQWCLFCREP